MFSLESVSGTKFAGLKVQPHYNQQGVINNFRSIYPKAHISYGLNLMCLNAPVTPSSHNKSSENG